MGRYIENFVGAFLLTPILAVLATWILSDLFVYTVRVLRYQQVVFSYEAILVTEQPTTENLGKDFSLHPMLFDRRGSQYSAEINGNAIQFTHKPVNATISPCEASFNALTIGCENVFSYDLEVVFHKYIRLTGDLGISSEQAELLSTPHYQFENHLKTLQLFTTWLFPLLMFIWITRRITTRLKSERRWVRLFALCIPWATGLMFWTYYTWGRPSFVAYLRGFQM